MTQDEEEYVGDTGHASATPSEESILSWYLGSEFEKTTATIHTA